MGSKDQDETAANRKTADFRTRVVRGKPADREFDIAFWQEQGDEAIFAAMWEMIVMVEEAKYGRQPTFQRTVTKIIRSRS
jgi:hypothetical protein